MIGGGQSALAVGYYLRRTNLKYLILDKEENPGMLNYLHRYEKKYRLSIQGPTHVESVDKEENLFQLVTSQGIFKAK